MFNDALAASQELEQAQTVADAAAQELEQAKIIYNKMIARLEGIIGSELPESDRLEAANTLAELRAEDPLPLKRAKSLSKAALKKSKLASKTAQTIKATAKEALDEIKEKGYAGMGAIWWMERELEET